MVCRLRSVLKHWTKYRHYNEFSVSLGDPSKSELYYFRGRGPRHGRLVRASYHTSMAKVSTVLVGKAAQQLEDSFCLSPLTGHVATHTHTLALPMLLLWLLPWTRLLAAASVALQWSTRWHVPAAHDSMKPTQRKHRASCAALKTLT